MKITTNILFHPLAGGSMAVMVLNLIIGLPLQALPSAETPSAAMNNSAPINSVVENLDRRIQRLLLRNLELRQQITELDTGLETARREKSEQQNQINLLAPLIEENHQLRQQLHVARGRAERLNQEVRRLSNESGLTDQQERLRRELDITIAAQREIEETANAFRNERRKLEEQLQQTSIEREIANRQSHGYRREIAELRERNQQLKKQLADRRPAAPKTGEEEVAERNRQIQTLRRSIAQLYLEKDSLTRELQKKTEARQEQEMELRRQQDEVRQMEYKLEELLNKHDKLARTNQQYLRLLQLQEQEIIRLEQITPSLIDNLSDIMMQAQKETPEDRLDENGETENDDGRKEELNR